MLKADYIVVHCRTTFETNNFKRYIYTSVGIMIFE